MDQPHVAYLPLAHVGRQHADGEIHGFAIVLPRGLEWADRKTILEGIGQLQKVWNNAANKSHLAFDWRVSPTTGETRKKTLHAYTWTRKARCWATVTPVVFGHFLRKLDDSRAFRIVSECCAAIGLPEPKHVRISTTSLHEGVPVSATFPSLSTRGKPVWTSFRNGHHHIPRELSDGTAVRMRYHVAIEFEEEVFGPVILGAGRYFGMGLCRPLFE
jgi:CRISPR-associated protein Csb2